MNDVFSVEVFEETNRLFGDIILVVRLLTVSFLHLLNVKMVPSLTNAGMEVLRVAAAILVPSEPRFLAP